MPACRRLRSRVSILLAPLLLAAPLVGGCGPGDRVAEVRELHSAGRFDESLSLLRALLDERPDDPEVQYLYGHALVQSGQMSLAQFALRKAMESREWLVPAGVELALANVITDNPEGAIEAATRILEAEPDHLDGLLIRARARAMSRQHYETALADAERALQIDPGNVEGLTLRAVCLLGLGRVEDADAALAELEKTARDVDLEPADSARFSAMRASFAKEKGDLETAERLFDEALKTHPADFLVVKEAIEFFDQQRRPERGVEILREALAELPTAGTFRRSLADRLRRGGDVAGAEKILREGTELENPAVAVESWVDLANHHHALGDYSAAVDALERAVAIEGRQDPQLLFDYADALVMAERYDEALEVARGMQVPAHRDLVEGRVALEQGRAAEALERFDSALRWWPDNEVARYYAALAAEGTGDFDRAIGEYRYSIRANPNATDARVRLARLHEAEGAGAQALMVLQHDAARNPAGFDAERVAARVMARLGRGRQLQALLARLAKQPGALGPAIAAAAEGVRDRQGPAAAADFIRDREQLDLTDPRDAEALRVLVGCLVDAGRAGEALAATRAAVAKHADAAAFHTAHAEALRATGAPPDEVRSAWSRALELDAEHAAAALAGLARLAAESGDAPGALELYARAAAQDPEDASALRAAAELLVSLGRREEAEVQLERALARDPYHGETAARLAELLLERNADLDRALALARRGVRFGSRASAEPLVARILERRGAPEAPSAVKEPPAPPGP
jgi:tetratricopeptide (TPR) repeat protein